MLGGILLLALVIFGICILFGIGKTENFYKFVIWLIAGPILLAIGFKGVIWFWFELPFWAQLLAILVAPFLVSALIRRLFPNAKWLAVVQDVLIGTLVSIVLFPFRFIWRAGRLLGERERTAARLETNRPVVGSRPPFDERRS